ncbi:MAG: gliding motility-associated ABC transporter permease subunit GldF [Flavobacteriaceae bacterium]
MFSILKKELLTFFASAIGYLVMGLFLLANGLLLWIFKSDYNILNTGFADLNSFFDISPWLFFFIIPAVTMRSFVDEKATGTLEILKSKPLTNWQILLGKYLGSFVLIVLSLLPTIIYIYSINSLSNPVGNIDLGPILGAYLGLFLIASSYTAIGIFASLISKNQIVAFLLAVIICFILFYGFEALVKLNSNDYNWAYLGMKFHYNSLARGLIDTRDIIYFLSVSVLFLLVSHKIIERQ